MASDIPPSVYLNAARAYCLARYDYDGPYVDDAAREHHIDSDARGTASNDAAVRAAVESVWEARGAHDADAIRRSPWEATKQFPRWCGDTGRHGPHHAEMNNGWSVECDGAPTGALDAQRPAEGGPEAAEQGGEPC